MSLDVSAERLAAYVDALAAFGRTPEGGVDRQVYTPVWVAARDQVAAWMRELGLAVRSDAVGNLFGRLDGTEPGVVLTGSHLDSVPNGGTLDGALGIVAGLTAVAALAPLGPPRRTLELVAICEEEDTRFPANFWGARALIGASAADELERLTDADGVTIGAAMQACRLDPDALAAARRTDVAAFLELHIEQGRLLEEAERLVGVVGAITGQQRAEVTVRGQADHAGTTPMDLRRDAYLGAAEMALGIAGVATRLGRPAVATVGRIRLAPGAPNVVPGEAVFSVDARHPDPERLVELLDRVRAVCREVAAARELEVSWDVTMDQAPRPMDAHLQEVLGRCADDLGIPWLPMISGAGHDAQILARAFPAAMLFVPSRGGRSHSPAEFTTVADMLPGVRVLTETLRRLAYEA